MRHPSHSPLKAEKAPDINSQVVALQCKAERQLVMFAEKEMREDKEKHSKGIRPAVSTSK